MQQKYGMEFEIEKYAIGITKKGKREFGWLVGWWVGWLFCFTAYQPFSGHLTPN